MIQYQRDNQITKQCVTNTQYLFDCINQERKNKAKAKAVIVFMRNDDSLTITAGHILVEYDNTLIDPSYEISKNENAEYYDSIKVLRKRYELSTSELKFLIETHSRFIKLADRINSGELTISDLDHYNKQADYIENK